MAKIDSGLENVVAAETVLSRVDGKKGELVIRGREIEDIASSMTFEQLIHHLWSGFFDDLPSEEDLGRKLGVARVEAFNKIAPLAPFLKGQPPLEAIRTAFSITPDGNDIDSAVSAIAYMLVATGIVGRLLNDSELVEPSASRSHAEDLLYMLSGETPSAELIAGANSYLVTVADHGLNASTFTARVVASTQAGLGSAVIAGFCALKGPLHGGAPGPVLDMIDSIGSVGNAKAWAENALDKGERLMGFGHRVYKIKDPRADALKTASSKIPGSIGRLNFAREVETIIIDTLIEKKPDRVLETNVEYYTAVLLEALNVDRELFTGIFGCGRCVGWIAHSREQMASKRIVRPKSVYVGPEPN